MEKDNNIGINFLNRVYPSLHIKLKDVSNEPKERIKAYLTSMEQLLDRMKSKHHLELFLTMFYNQYIITEANIPESEFELQRRIIRERNEGNIEITDDLRKEYSSIIIKDQKDSLRNILEYLNSEDAYPLWAKVWAFNGIINMGEYDKEKEAFKKRTKTTAKPFLDLNSEIFAECIDYIIANEEKRLNVEDEDLVKIIKSGSFSSLYAYLLNEYELNIVITTDEGIWKKYNKGSTPDELEDSLKGYATGWCTRGYEVAKNQLNEGDFYVYYSKDQNGEYIIPRLAIRMQGNNISEIRGRAKNQNIESNMEEILSEKLKEFPDRDKYYEKVNDMRLLTEITNKVKK